MTPAVPDPLASLQTGALHRFSDRPHPDIPPFAAGVYAVWLDGSVFAYAGMAGRSIMPGTADNGKRSGLASRLASHASGRRSGDQFCVYVADRLVMPVLTRGEIEAIAAGCASFDKRLRGFIHDRMGYRFVVLPSGAEARAVEAMIRAGRWAPGAPLPNPSRRGREAGRLRQRETQHPSS
jgi:hypothetical protein